MIALAANQAATNADVAITSYPQLNANGNPAIASNAGVITRKQAAIWIPIILAIISIAAVYALYAIDDIKSRDTILYAKFLANLKDK